MSALSPPAPVTSFAHITPTDVTRRECDRCINEQDLDGFRATIPRLLELPVMSQTGILERAQRVWPGEQFLSDEMDAADSPKPAKTISFEAASYAMAPEIRAQVVVDAKECIKERDLRALWRMLDKIARLEAADRIELRLLAKQAFKSDLNLKDWDAEVKAHEPRAAPAPPPKFEGLIVDSNGRSKAVIANAIAALRSWRGVLAFNEFALRIEAIGAPPWPGATVGLWTDHEDRLATEWLQHEGILVPVQVASQAVETVAKEHPFHPIREYLDNLTWDGTSRIEGWMSLYLGCDHSPYVSAVGKRWLISAVARVYQPGVKADCAVILEGEQGLRKSTALRVLAGTWFTDEVADLGSKDSAMQTSGVWIVELAELDSMTRGEVSKIKAFMSRSTDRFRPPYGRRVIEAPRQCVFAGTVNHGAYLRDETGGRRFWPVACTRILVDELARDRDQLWAEAVHRFRSGETWWLDTVELNRTAAVEQSDRYEGDAWDEIIAAWVENPSQRYGSDGHPIEPFSSDRESTTIGDVLTHGIGKRPETWTQADKVRVARSLKSIGYERFKAGTRSSREWRYRRVTTP
jgi:predicted P-loop ATPase